MPISGNRKSITGGNFGSPKIDLGGCVLYAPLWRPELAGSPFNSNGVYGIPTQNCTVTGALWTSQGRRFDGIDDSIDCGSASVLDDLAPFTFLAWIYPTGAGEGGNGTVIWKETAGNSGTFFQLYNNDLRLLLRIDHATDDVYRYGTAGEVKLNIWQQVVATWDGSTTAANGHIYINTIEITYGGSLNGVGARVSDAANNLLIGNNLAGSFTFAGTIGEVLIYNRALTPLEIQRNYQTTKWRYS